MRVNKWQIFCQKVPVSSDIRVRIIALHFANCRVNSSFYNYKFVNHTKIVNCFFSKENVIRLNYIFPHYILILLIYCILLSKEILLIPKIAPQNAKNTSQLLKNMKDLLRSAYLLRNEFQTVIRTIDWAIFPQFGPQCNLWFCFHNLL